MQLRIAPELENKLVRASRAAVLTGALIVTLATLLFFGSYFNRFAGVRSGNGPYLLAREWLAGRLPYRDYFATSPPLNLAKSAAVLAIFGDKLIVLRAFALAERSFLALLLYFWLRRFFRASHAAMAAILAIVVSAGDLSDPLTSYNHDAIFWAVLGGFLASFALDGASLRRIAIFAAGSGVGAGLCFSTKQTVGLGALTAIPIVCAIFLARLDGWRKAALFVAAFAAGALTPLAVLFAWLAKLGMVHAFFEQNFVRGPSAKSLGGDQFLMRTWYLAKKMWPMAILGIGACFASWRAVRRSSDHTEPRATDSTRQLAPILVAATTSIAAGIALAQRGVSLLPILTKATIYFVLLACPAVGLVYGWMALRGRVTRRQAQYCLLAAISFVTASMLSLSWPAFEAMVMPGLGFLTAAAVDGASQRWRRAILFVLCPALLLMETCYKLDNPHGFEGWFDPPVRESIMRSSLPEMSGILLPPGMVRLIDGTVGILRANTGPGDTIFTFPGMPIFYALTGLRPPTLLGEHNIDVVDNQLAKEEAERLLRHPPKVIIYFRQPEEYLEEEEMIWRRGQRAGQRDIIAAIERLIKDYRLAGSFEGPKQARTVLVYVRN